MPTLPPRPSLEQLRKQAKDLARAKNIKLSAAQLVTAREYGFTKWESLVEHVRATRGQSALQTPLIRPVELRPGRPYTLADGTVVTTDDVFAMFVAARGGDLTEVKRLIARAPGLALVEYNYTPPIHFAVREGHLGMVKLLIDRGADLAYRSYPFQDSLLTIAEDHEHEEVAALLRGHITRRFKLRDGVRIIIDAAEASDLNAVHAELSRDPSLAAAANDTGDTALHHAALRRNLAIAETLLQAGADPDAVRGDGYRPIHLALMKNFVVGGPAPEGRAIADLLLARGARWTMFLAALVGDEEFIRRALARDRSAANEEDTNHHRPISAAARRGDFELVRLLLEHGANPSLPEEGAPRGHALWNAVYHNHVRHRRAAARHGADPNGMVESSGTPMDMAAATSLRCWSCCARMAASRGTARETQSVRAIAERRFADAERLIAAIARLSGRGELGGWNPCRTRARRQSRGSRIPVTSRRSGAAGLEVGAVLLLQARANRGVSARSRNGPEPHELASRDAPASHGGGR